MDITTPRRRGPGLRLEIGVIGAVVMALILMVGAAQGLGRVSSRDLAQAEVEGMKHGLVDSSHDGSVTLQSGSTRLDATGLQMIDVTTDNADFEVQFVDTTSATLDVEREVAPNLSWVLQREGDHLVVAAQRESESVNSKPAADPSPTAGAQPTADPSPTAGAQPTATAVAPAQEPTGGQTPDASADQKPVKVTLTLPEELRDQSIEYTYHVLGGTFTTAKASGYTTLMVLGGAADIRGNIEFFSAKVTSGQLDFHTENSQSVDLEVSGEASITGEFTGSGPQYLDTVLSGGAMDLTLSKDMTSYDLRISNQFGELNNLLKKSTMTPNGQYPEVTIEGNMTGGSLTLR